MTEKDFVPPLFEQSYAFNSIKLMKEKYTHSFVIFIFESNWGISRVNGISNWPVIIYCGSLKLAINSIRKLLIGIENKQNIGKVDFHSPEIYISREVAHNILCQIPISVSVDTKERYINEK